MEIAAMVFFDQTLPTLAENLALDEALLLTAEDGGPEVLRVWQWPSYAVVLGAGGRIADDVHEDRCRADGVPLARRSSGGGTVLLGPGCLLYSLVLAYDRDPALTQIRSSYCHILKRVAAALGPIAADLAVRGSSDLAQMERKVSGNAQQRKRTHLLHHGTLLYEFDIERIAMYLKPPPRQPEYRRLRGHGEFLMNLPSDADSLKRYLCTTWEAGAKLAMLDTATLSELVEKKYAQDEWVRRR
jgi:lipoate-protein ligase A